MKFRYLSFIAVMLLCAGALAAQDIVVEYPAGTALTNGTKIKLGKSSNGDIINATVVVGNADAMTTLDLATGYVDGSGYKNVSVSFTSPAAPISLDDVTTINIDLAIDPKKDSDWSFNLIITSNDPVDSPFSVRFEGTQGSPDSDDDDCSTSEGSSYSWLMLLGILSAVVVASRMRGSQA
jgi:hypothetical protein